MSNAPTRSVSSNIWRPQATLSHVIGNVSDIDRLNAEGGIAISFRPYSRSPIDLQFDGSQSEALSIWRTNSSTGFASYPKIQADLFTMRFIIKGSMLRKNRGGGEFTGGAGWVTLLPFESMIEDRASVGFSALSVTITRQALLSANKALYGGAALALPHFIPVVEVDNSRMIALRQSVNTMHAMFLAGIGSHDFVFPLMEEIIGYQILSIWPNSDFGLDKPQNLATWRVINIAISYIDARIAHKMSILEIANVTGISVRALQSSFRKHMGCTPFQYIINRRLEKVHEMLETCDSELTVREIAMQWGFVHMSDFSRRYKIKYGYTPTSARIKNSN